jgi:hypothetical protein
VYADSRYEGFRCWFVPSEASSIGTRSDIRNTNEIEKAAKCAVFATRSVKCWPDDIGHALSEVRKQAGVWIAQFDVSALRAETIGDAAARPKGNVAFMRNAAGENQYASG